MDSPRTLLAFTREKLREGFEAWENSQVEAESEILVEKLLQTIGVKDFKRHDFFVEGNHRLPETSKEILKKFKDNFENISLESLQSIKGMSLAKSTKIISAIEISTVG